MSEKRRDNKGRILKTGESQRKDGRYLYNIQIHLENRNLFTRGNLWLQTEYQQESVIVSHLERKSQSYRKTFMMVLMLQERK